MTDRLGYRRKIGMLVPAFNATLQPELEAMRPEGVTHHVARIEISDGPLLSDEDQSRLVTRVMPGVPAALRQVIPVGPDIIVHGISIPTFWDGPAAARRMQQDLEQVAGTGVVIGSIACE